MATDRVGVELFLDNDQFVKESRNSQAIMIQSAKKMQKGIGALNASIIRQTELINQKTVAQTRSAKATKTAKAGLVDFSNSITLFNVGLAGAVFGAFRAVKGLISLGDQYSLLRSQVRLVIDSQESLEAVQQQILKTANETRQSVASTTELYTKLDRATRELYLSDKQVLDLTQTLNKAFIISGASAEESSNGVRQLSQAIQGGVLRAEEYNSIIEQTPRIAELFAKSLKKTQGEFRKLVIEGKVTTKDLIEAIQGQSDAINEEFKSIETTSGQTWVVLTNNAESYIAKLKQVNAFQKGFNSLLGAISGAFENLNNAKTLEIAEKTKVENRTFEQQQVILANLIEQKNKSNKFDQAVQRNLNASFVQAEKDLQLILNRTNAQKAKTEADKEAAAEIQKKADTQFRYRKELAEEEKLYEKQIAQYLVADKAAKDYNDTLNELLRTEQQRISENQESQALKAFEFEKEIMAERELINATAYEKEIARINNEKDARLLVAGEIAQSETELIKAVEQIYINSAMKKRAVEKAQLNATINQNLQAIGALSGALAAAFKDNKAFAYANTVINTSSAIMKALSEPSLPFPANAIQATAIGIQGAAELNNIRKQKFQFGGVVEGKSTGDQNQVFANRGELFLTQEQQANLFSIANGASPSGGNASPPQIVVVTDLFNEEEVAQRLVNRSALAEQLGLTPQV